jgi:PAS domain S-box-containing protein
MSEKEELLRLFIEHAPSALAMFDRDMRYLYLSRRWRCIYDLGEREMQGLSHNEIFPETGAAWQEAHRRGLAGEVLKSEGDRYERADGSIQWIRWELRPWFNSVGEVGGTVIFTEDITDRKQAEQQVRSAALFPEENPFPVLRVDGNGLLVFANRAAAAMISQWRCSIGGTVPDFVRREVTAALESGAKRELEVICGEQDYSFVLVPIPERGYVNLYGSDLTERKHAEQMLRESEFRYRELVENANSAIIRWRSDGALVFFNEYAQNFFGYTAAEVIGRHVSFLLPDADSAESDLSSLAQDIVDHPEHYVYNINENICRDGRRVWMAWANKPIFNKDGHVTEILAIGTDITERIQAEAALQESEERFRQLADSMPQLVWTASPAGDIDYFNERHCEFKGLSQRSDGTWEWLTALHPDDVAKTVEAWQSVLHSGMTYQVEHRTQCADGSFAWSLSRAKPILNQAGEIIKWFGTTTDVDDLKQAEHAIEEARKAAEAANRAKGEFLATMSHEIRTPMTIFMGAIEHLKHIDRNLKHRELLDLAEQSSQRLHALVSDILDFSKIDARRVDIADDWFNLRSCLEECVGMMTTKAREKNLRLELEVASSIPENIVGDHYRLGQILLNLIGNAIKFTDAGEVKVAVQDHDDMLEFTVSDTGIGIPEGKQEKIFQTFSQVDSSSTRRHGGTGLGLAICKGLVELMGGRISVRSRVDQGSVFTFTLPMTNAKSRDSAGSAKDGKPLTTVMPEAHILLVEDNPMVQEVILMALSRRPWQTTTAGSGRDAVQKWQTGHFDLILMDLQMPDMDGLETTRQIRQQEAGKDKKIGIIGLTAHASRAIQQKCFDAGMSEVLIKPFKTASLYAAIERSLAG